MKKTLMIGLSMQLGMDGRVGISLRKLLKCSGEGLKGLKGLKGW